MWMFGGPSGGGVYQIFYDRGDPSEIDFLTPTFIADGVWHDLDLSGIVPHGSFAVLVRVRNGGASTATTFRFRKKGNVNALNILDINQTAANFNTYRDGIVFCDSNSVIQYITPAGSGARELTVRGWWK